MAQIRDFDSEIPALEAEVSAKHGDGMLARLQTFALVRGLTPKEAVELLEHADLFVAAAEAEESAWTDEERAEQRRRLEEWMVASERDSQEFRAECRAKVAELKAVHGDAWHAPYRRWAEHREES